MSARAVCEIDGETVWIYDSIIDEIFCPHCGQSINKEEHEKSVENQNEIEKSLNS